MPLALMECPVAATKNIANSLQGAAASIATTPDYWAEACKHLMKKDRVMKRLIPQFVDATLQTRGDAFTTLARSIVGQQISVKAAQTVWERFAALPRNMKPVMLNVNSCKGRWGVCSREWPGTARNPKAPFLRNTAIYKDSGVIVNF